MKLYGRSSIHEFLADHIAYRNLNPLDARLPSLDELRASVRIPHQSIPRKTSPDYASLVSHLLQRARALEAPKAKIKRLIFVGDTRLNDATAFNNICASTSDCCQLSRSAREDLRICPRAPTAITRSWNRLSAMSSDFDACGACQA